MSRYQQGERSSTIQRLNVSRRQERNDLSFGASIAIGLVGLALTAAVFVTLWGQAKREADDRLTSQVESAAELTSTALATVDAKLVSLSGFFRSSVMVTPGEFQRFTDDVGVEDGMAGIGYVISVDAEGLSAAEILLGSQSGSKKTAYQLDASGMPTELGLRDRYHLVQYVSPRLEWESLQGLDLGALPDIESDFNSAIDTGRVAMTPFITLPGEADADTFLMFLSVNDPTTGEHLAMVVALMDFSDLLLSHIPSGVESYLDWQFSEVDPAVPATGAAGTSVLSYGGRDWLINVAPTADSPFGPDHNGGYVVLLLGFVATLLAMAAVHLYRQRVEGAAELEAANQSTDAKVRFIAAISHELRTPLTSVLGFADILKDGDDLSTEERYSMMKAITEEATDLAHIIDDLLVAARGEIGQLVVAKSPVALRDEVQAVVGVSGLGDRVVIWPAADGPEVAIGDPVRVRQILRNLLENAHRYGGTRIEIEIARSPGSLWVEMRDDGSGVPVSILNTLFEPYQHAADTPGVTESLGLGLSVSRQLADLMDGEMTHQRKGAWTIFRLTLPVKTQISAEEAPVRSNGLPLTGSRRP